MPVYNAEKYIGDSIASVLQQSFIDFELLIINDGSTDKTEKIIRGFADPRIRLINQTNQGIAAALNNGLQIARADYIARFDADDICMPERLQIQYDFLRTLPDYVIVGSNADYIDMNDVEQIRAKAKYACPQNQRSVCADLKQRADAALDEDAHQRKKR